MKSEFVFKGFKANGILMILVSIAMLGLSVATFFLGNWLPIVGMLLIILSIFIWIGLVLIEPNECCALILFGVYKGTIKENGFFFVNPFFSKKKLSLRARNMDIEPIKVNDKIGNPIMIGLVLVWKVEDTYKLLFDVDADMSIVATSSGIGKKVNSYDRFVGVQSDSALRIVAGLYSYDNFDNEHHGATLLASGTEVHERLEQELSERLSIAGIKVVEARINYLAYASEIAGAMLRRQQATAIIAAREKIVEGAVTMVQLALNKLAEKEIVNLDEDKKAAMVSNLMVVLCSDESAQPVLNTGSLYQ